MKIIDFYADWCQPCKAMEPIVEQLLTEHPRVKIEKINVDKQPDYAQLHGVMSIPTFIFVDDRGEEVGREVGSVNKESLEQHIK
jgi:thioredoxin 1